MHNFKPGDLVRCNPDKFNNGCSFSSQLNAAKTNSIESFVWLELNSFINEIAEVIQNNRDLNVLWWPRLKVYNFLSDDSLTLVFSSDTTTEE